MSIYAWRAWLVRHEPPGRFSEPRLHSVNMPAMWRPDVPRVAYCYCWGSRPERPERHLFPPASGGGFTCGIHATKTPGIALDYITPFSLLGVVELWGRIVSHRYGYRAQFARPVALTSDPALSSEVDHPRLGAIYHIPVLPSVEALGKEFGLEFSLLWH